MTGIRCFPSSATQAPRTGRRGRVRCMGTVHRLITAGGKQAALQEGMFERAEVEAAASYLSDEDPAIGFLYLGFCQAALPHKRLPDAEGWHVQSNRVSLIVEPGMRLGRAGSLEPVGFPYGSRARLILISDLPAKRSYSHTIEGHHPRTQLARLAWASGHFCRGRQHFRCQRSGRADFTLPPNFPDRTRSSGRFGQPEYHENSVVPGFTTRRTGQPLSGNCDPM
jgi:hypothetical protein